VNNENGRENCRRLKKDLQKAIGKPKKKYLESVCEENTEFQRTGHCDLMYMQTKELGWEDNHGIQNAGIVDSQRKQ
jgi:hypothetical protein